MARLLLTLFVGALAVALQRPADADGIMLVQAGAFWMGRDDGRADEAPLHRVYVRDFWIERHKVTNAEFAAFLDARGLASDDGLRRYDADDADARIHRRTTDEAHAGWVADRGYERHPVVEASWFGARDYCAWKGRRLPTEAEWEKAAAWDPATGESRRYPWGDSPPSAAHANLGVERIGPAPAGAYPEGASPSGALGMVGDQWEWTASEFGPYAGFRAHPYREYSEVFFGRGYRVLRGGSWATSGRVADNRFRNWDLPQRRQIFAGVRCAA